MKMPFAKTAIWGTCMAVSLVTGWFTNEKWHGDETAPAAVCVNKTGRLDALLKEAGSVCFIGDSVTAGSENGGVPWFVPLVSKYRLSAVSNIAAGGATTHSQLKVYEKERIAANLYVFAIGANDVRYRDGSRCAMTADEYIHAISQMVGLAQKASPSAKFVFIAPWHSIPEDPVPPVPRAEVEALMGEYAAALKEYCAEHGHLFIDPNPSLSFILNDPYLRQEYVIDHIHPNGTKGVYLYSSAVLQNSL